MTEDPFDTHRRLLFNGWPALILRLEGTIDSELTVRVTHGLVAALYTVRNPDKLSRMTTGTAFTR